MSKIKKTILILLVLILGVSLFSCKSSKWGDNTYEQVTSLTSEESKALVKKGYLTVGTSPDYSPYEFLDYSKKGINKFQGSDIFLADYLAQSLGLKLNIKQVSFDGLITSLQSGKIDIILSGLTYSDDRAENYSFTDKYYDSGDGGQVLLVKNDIITKFSTLEDFNNATITIGVQNGSIQQPLVENQLPNAKVQLISAVTDGINLLNKGSIQALALSKNNASQIVLSHPELSIFSQAFVYEDTGTMGLLNKGSILLNKINTAIASLKEGQYQDWINQASIIAQNAVTVAPGNFFTRFFSILSNYGTEFLKGTGITLLLSFVTVIFGLIIAVFLTVLRKNKNKPLKVIGNAYVEIIRGIPLLLLLWLLFSISPASWPTFISVTIALFLNSAAYVAEIIRAGIDAVDKGQYEAARALGMSKFLTMKKVVLPQAIKKIMPALGNEFVMLIKETSLASVFFIGDLMTIKNNITAITYLSIEPFIIVGIIYFVMTFGATKLIKILEKKLGD